ncbi:DNA-binding protein [Oceanobacillus piezotolerans]|uniref:DNA-binding protein n=1 Tax=Oceanobacillus piezotolerans TaxID=2448030 RepID=A0A498DTZ4_9BACI|nr:DNA-binding protein [Oceanobacillus piezotolerans]RLL48327.1 DNA-binding protein [Oceanobacillus piezotolerans]
MEIEISGLGTGLVLLAVGLTLMGYFIGKGLQNMGHPEKGQNYHLFLKESELEFYLNLDKNEITELLRRNPDAPKINLNGTTYYPYRQFMDWVSSNDTYK